MTFAVKALTDDQLANLKKEVCEEIRFRTAIAQSTPAVRAVTKYLLAKGFFEVRVVAETEFVDRKIFKDAGADLVCRRWFFEPFLLGEVKHRTFDFCSRETFPFETIIIDRATKNAKLDLYFNVNRDMTSCAIVTLSSQRHWKEVKIFDKTRGYHSVNLECPKELASFVTLEGMQ